MTTHDLLAELDRAIAAAPPEERAGLVVQLAARLAALGAGLAATGNGSGSSDESDTRDENLGAPEAARRLGMSTDWLYRQKKLPFRVEIGRRVLFSARGLERWNRQRRT